MTLTKDNTYKNFRNFISKENIVILKDSSIVTLGKKDYIVKLKDMIQDGINKGTYKIKQEDTLQDLKHFQNFLRRNFKNYQNYKEIYPKSNQPSRIYGTAKAHKFN